MRTPVLPLCVLALLLVLPASASADLTVPGQRILSVECDLAFGPYEDYAARKYEVVEGDTLEKIAAAKLGKAQRWTEITAINDGLDHKALKVGQTLWLPAAKAPKAKDRVEREAKQAPAHWWHFFAAPGGGHFGNTFERIAHDGRVPEHHYYTRVFAVRSDQFKAFQKAAAERGENSLGTFIETWKTKPGFVVGNQDLPGRTSVSEANAAVSQIEKWEITKIKGDEIVLRRSELQRFDGAGEKVRRMSGLSGVNGLLLALSFAALAGIVALVRRRNGSVPNA